MNILTLTGTPIDRGRSYGGAMRDEIAGQIAFFDFWHTRQTLLRICPSDSYNRSGYQKNL